MGRLSDAIPRIVAAAGILLACNPTEPCACPPAITVAVLRGHLVDSLAAPVAGATVTAVATRPRLGIPPCALDSFPEPMFLPQATSDSAGNFGGQLISPYSPAQRCLRLVVTMPGGGAQVVRDSLVLMFGALHRPDTLSVVVIAP